MVREEIHRWIFGNVAAKWKSVLRLQRRDLNSCLERLNELFPGYQKDHKRFLNEAVVLSDLDPAQICVWEKNDLHLLVAHFLIHRFPICLALNKLDSLLSKHSQNPGEIKERLQCESLERRRGR